MLCDRLVLVCPRCQQSANWTAALDRCERCASTHLIRRLGQVECLDCGHVRNPAPAAAGTPAGAATAAGSGTPAKAGTPGAGPDPVLAEEVSRAAREESDRRVDEEAADLLYHLLVLLRGRDRSLADAERVLDGRRR